jgi:hypothetical protein
MPSRLFSFIGGNTGPWGVTHVEVLSGAPLPVAKRLGVVTGAETSAVPDPAWMLRGITSNERYVDSEERIQIVGQQLALGRPEATRAALIPVRKKDAWWALTQNQRLDIFKAQSHHTQIGLQTFPQLARRLHHCRDLSENEPFDFITWFEYEPEDEPLFNTLLAALRATEEWRYVEREIDIRLARDAG